MLTASDVAGCMWPSLFLPMAEAGGIEYRESGSVRVRCTGRTRRQHCWRTGPSTEGVMANSNSGRSAMPLAFGLTHDKSTGSPVNQAA